MMPSRDSVEAQVVAPLTEHEAVDAAAVFHELLKRDDPYALTRTIEHVLKMRQRDTPASPTDHKWLDPECTAKGCQSLFMRDAEVVLDNAGAKYGDGTLTLAQRIADLVVQRNEAYRQGIRPITRERLELL